MKTPIVEICVDSFEAALAAQTGGAHRIELCQNLHEGGTTPSAGTIRRCCQELDIPVHVLIRPRGGDFLYSASEYETVKQEIQFAKELGCAGVVCGALLPTGEIDTVRTKEMVMLADTMSFTFHRAFDMCRTPFEAVEDLIACDCDRILTSGLEQNAIKGAPLLRHLINQAGNRIKILVGGGVRPHNIFTLKESTGAIEFHATARDFVYSKMKHKNKSVKMGADGEEFQWKTTSAENVAALIAASIGEETEIDAPFSRASFVAIDFETATNERNSACAVGIVVVEKGVIVEEFYRLIQPPGNSYNWRNIQVHGIKPDETRYSPTFESVFIEMAARFKDHLLVAHNAPFDKGVLKACMDYYQLEHGALFEKNRWADTCRIYRSKGFKPANLAACSQRMGIELNHHEALSDARACAKLYLLQ